MILVIPKKSCLKLRFIHLLNVYFIFIDYSICNIMILWNSIDEGNKITYYDPMIYNNKI